MGSLGEEGLEEGDHTKMSSPSSTSNHDRVSLTVLTSLEINNSPSKNSPTDTDSGFEKCLNSPSGSPGSSKSNPSSGGQSSPDSAVSTCICESAKDSGCIITRDQNSTKLNQSPKKGILKNTNLISEGFVNLAFDEFEEENGAPRSRPNSLIAHEMALFINCPSDKNKMVAGNAKLDNQHTNDRFKSPLDRRVRRNRQHKIYWFLLGFVVLLLVAAAIVIPILWITQGNSCYVILL